MLLNNELNKQDVKPIGVWAIFIQTTFGLLKFLPGLLDKLVWWNVQAGVLMHGVEYGHHHQYCSKSVRKWRCDWSSVPGITGSDDSSQEVTPFYVGGGSFVSWRLRPGNGWGCLNTINRVRSSVVDSLIRGLIALTVNVVLDAVVRGIKKRTFTTAVKKF